MVVTTLGPRSPRGYLLFFSALFARILYFAGRGSRV